MHGQETTNCTAQIKARTATTVSYLCIYLQAGKLATLSSKDFMMLVKLIEKFVSDCAAITGRNHPNLRAPLLSQVTPPCKYGHILTLLSRGRNFLKIFMRQEGAT